MSSEVLMKTSMFTGMDKVIKGIASLLLLTSSALTQADDIADNIEPFTIDSFAAIKAQYEGEPFFVSLWSVDCPPCRVELDMLGELVAVDPDLSLVLISTDQISEREYANEILEVAGLDSITSWMFADSFAERLRFTIDPQWFGELPRSYYYDADHNSRAHSGIMTRDMLDEFIQP